MPAQTHGQKDNAAKMTDKLTKEKSRVGKGEFHP